jgi:ribose transport system substrate-binding protein
MSKFAIPRRTRALGLVASLALVAIVPGAIVAQDEAPPDNPYFETGAVEGSGEGIKIGYISLGDSLPFVKLVSDSVKEQAEIAGVDLVFCDSQFDPGEALACGQLLGVQEVQGVINFQLFEDSSPEICAAYGDVPTIAVDIVQPPCQVAFMGANNREAGRIGGSMIGQYASDNWGCEYDAYISLESSGAGSANFDRHGGYIDGFSEHCEFDPDKHFPLDGADNTDLALEAVSNLLPSLPGDKIIVVGINEDGILGAIAAARTQGREGDLIYSGQGTDPSIWKDVACNPQYIGSVAYFPERYGRTVIPAMIDILNGNEVSDNLFTVHEVITADNIRDVYPDTPACDA